MSSWQSPQIEFKSAGNSVHLRISPLNSWSENELRFDSSSNRAEVHFHMANIDPLTLNNHNSKSTFFQVEEPLSSLFFTSTK